MVELVLAVLGLRLLVLLAVVSATLLVFKKSRGLGKYVGVATGALGVLGLAVYLGMPVIREARAKSIINQVAPLISAIDRHRQETGSYPDDLTRLDSSLWDLSFCPELGYKMENDTYSLRFRLAGPPFGHHFIYQPSRLYPDWWKVGDFFLKETIDGWGWYLKV